MSSTKSLFRAPFCAAVALAVFPGCEKQRTEAPPEPTRSEETAALATDNSGSIAKLSAYVLGKEVQSEAALCPPIEEAVASLVAEDEPMMTVVPEPYVAATAPSDEHVGLQLAGVTLTIPNRRYAVELRRRTAVLTAKGFRVTLSRMPPQLDPPLRPLFDEGTTQFDLMSRSLVISAKEVSCQPGSERRALADLYVLKLKLILFPRSDAPDSPGPYHSYTGAKGQWMLQHEDAHDKKTEDRLSLYVGTDAGGMWMVMFASSDSVLEDVVLEADVSVAADSVGQLAVRYLDGDACAAKQLLASHDIKKGAEHLEARAKECREP